MRTCTTPSANTKLFFCASCFSCVALVFLLASARGRNSHASSNAGTEAEPEGELVLAQVVFRHGARTPLTNLYWPEQQWSSCSPQRPGSINISLYDAEGSADVPVLTDGDSAPQLPGGCRMGRLTDNGWLMAVRLGQELRDLYTQQHKLLPARFQPGVLQAETTAYERTVETLRGVLTGLYPPASVNASLSGSATAGARSQAVLPVATRWPEDEIMIGSNATCAVLPGIAAVFQQEQDRRAAGDTHSQQLMALIREAFHFPPELPFLWNRLRDTLSCMAADGKAIPFAKAAKRYFRVIDYIAVQRKLQLVAPDAGNCLGSQQQCQEVVQLSIGLLLNKLAANMDAAAAAAAVSADTAAPRAAAVAARGGPAGVQYGTLPTAEAASSTTDAGAAPAAATVAQGAAAAAATAAAAPPVVGWQSKPSMYANRARGVPPLSKLMAQQLPAAAAATAAATTAAAAATAAAALDAAAHRSHASSSSQDIGDEPSAAAGERELVPGQLHQGRQRRWRRGQRKGQHQRRRRLAAAVPAPAAGLGPAASAVVAAAQVDLQPLLFDHRRQQLQPLPPPAPPAASLQQQLLERLQQHREKLQRDLPEHRQLLVGAATAPTEWFEQQQQQQRPDWLQQLQQELQALVDAAAVEVATDAAVEAAALAQAQAQAAAAQLPGRLVLFSAHDTTLMPLLTALGQQQHQWPPFASYLSFELWRQQGRRYSVRVLHDGTPLKLKVTAGDSSAAGSGAGMGSSSSSSGGGGASIGGTAMLLTGLTGPSDVGDSGSSSSSGGRGSRMAERQAEGDAVVSLAVFKQRVIRRYAISREAHAAACQLPPAT